MTHEPLDPEVTTSSGIFGIILAGGRSSRMGFDKLSAEVDGVPMLSRVASAVGTLCDEIVIVGGGGPELPGVRRTTDSRPDFSGPLAGMEAGMLATSDACDIAFVCAGDMPFVSRDFALALIGRVREGARASVPEHPSGNPHPLFAAYSRDTAPEVRTALDAGSRSMRGFLSLVAESGRVEYVSEGISDFGEPDVILMNVNSTENLDLARSLRP